MTSSDCAPALTFHQTELQLLDRGGVSWIRGSQIASALGYSDPRRAIAEIYDRNAAEFTDSMTALVKLPTAGGPQEVRIFSLRGAHLLGMFARTERAAEFRRWVLDVLERQHQAPALSAPDLAATLQRVVAERDALRAMLAERHLAERPIARKVLYYYGIPGLTHKERALLCGWKNVTSYYDELKLLATLGLVDYQAHPALQANGQRNIEKARTVMKSRNEWPVKPKAPKHPARERPRQGGDAQHMAKMRAAAAARRSAAKVSA